MEGLGNGEGRDGKGRNGREKGEIGTGSGMMESERGRKERGAPPVDKSWLRPCVHWPTDCIFQWQVQDAEVQCAK